MERQLEEEKVAFFECLQSYTNDDDGEDDSLCADEEAYRQKTRSFYIVVDPTSPKNVSSPILPKEIGADAISGEPVPDPIPSKDDPEIEIISVTPRRKSSKSGKPSLRISPSLGDNTVSETTAAARQPQRRTTRSMHSSLLSRHSNPQGDPSPSVRVGKRKREPPLKLAPEARRIFKDLSFFYIPNDDINPARRLQIRKAREHGATWCRKLSEATHIIVDKKLTYADIERQLQDDPKWSEKVLVNENYPIDCLKHRIIANPDQRQYKILGTPTVAEQQPAGTIDPSLSDDPDASLELKPRRRKSARRHHSPVLSTQPRSQSSSQRSAALAKNGVSPPKRIAEIDVDDELTQCISETKATGKTDILDGSLIVGNDTAGLTLTDEMESLSDSSNYDDGRQWKRRTRSSIGNSKGKSPAWQENFICMKGGTKDDTDNNPNAETIKVLQEMLDQHTLTGDNFRIRAYRLAIATLRTQPKKICTAEEARALPHIGRIADKIEEIVNTNRLRQLEYALDDPQRRTIGLFLQIYGVGQIQAHKWLAQGFRTLDDLRNRADLNANQKIGLEHFDDLNTRIPRREVEALAGCVRETAAAIDRHIELIVGGSYRRGAESSGDIDLIVTKKGTTSTSQLAPFLNRLVDTLTREGFLTVALAAHHSGVDDVDGGSKWHGCCVLPKHAFPGPKSEYRPTWGRIDLLLAPQTELGAALIYFTGNDIFNRSIRLLAQKKGMRLNQRGLFGNVLRGQGNIKMNGGTLLEGQDERGIFKILGVRWREPYERWCG
ncbi:uncharacterized protein F4812DRAFT_451609 [Daldinia caldariorum]|uniref:uncharacterized protein n=1 Tax=Daldinia caldariorum TaxID=326644 RepID=UPI002007B79E|nr:uncharacterized protein F4812DRAFT_451609 [Daldinia caldariorum]KAI1466642.1 hypothetical protein F4812DRAFT_451609 [Daldinia caldariorum]